VGFDPAACPSCLAAFEVRYNAPILTPGVDIFGPWSGQLPDAGGKISLEKPQEPDVLGAGVSWILIDEVIYFGQSPWPAIPEGGTKILQRRPELLYGNDPAAWLATLPTPGRPGIAAADVDANAAVDLWDLAAFSDAWLSEAGEGNWNPACDVSIPSDGIIDLGDLLQFAGQWLIHLRPSP
jgi:hypothetical protein